MTEQHICPVALRQRQMTGTDHTHRWIPRIGMDIAHGDVMRIGYAVCSICWDTVIVLQQNLTEGTSWSNST